MEEHIDFILLATEKECKQERVADWGKKFGSALGLRVVEISGDSNVKEASDLDAADIICTTPEKFGLSKY